MYHREDGRIVKLEDDLMGSTRYAVMMLDRAEPYWKAMDGGLIAGYGEPGNRPSAGCLALSGLVS